MIIDSTAQSIVEKKGDPSNLNVQRQVDDAPPPYDGQRAAWVNTPLRTASGPPAPAPVPIRASQSLLQPSKRQLVNHFSLFSRHDAITGTYDIDPLLPAVSRKDDNFGSKILKFKDHDWRVDRDHARHTRRAFGAIPGSDSDSDSSGHRHKKHHKRHSNTPEVNAAFRTRHGAIKLDLAVVNSSAPTATDDIKDKRIHGRVMLSSRHGSITANLTTIHNGRCVDLDVSTRTGRITVFLPVTFSGVIAFHTRNGPKGINFMPAFAERMRIVRGSDREMLVVLSSVDTAAPSGSTLDANGTSREGDDYCAISTRHGKITIGLCGQDEASSARLNDGGLIGKFEALVEAGAKQLGTMVEAGAKNLETWVEAQAKALETTLTGHA